MADGQRTTGKWAGEHNIFDGEESGHMADWQVNHWQGDTTYLMVKNQDRWQMGGLGTCE